MPQSQSVKAIPLMNALGERPNAEPRRRSEAWTRPAPSAGLYDEIKSWTQRASLTAS
jgi:hypothetical protein